MTATSARVATSVCGRRVGRMSVPGQHAKASTSSATSRPGDTDEFDQSVIAHEFGHYFEDRFGRSDSIGGTRRRSTCSICASPSAKAGATRSGMALVDPVYRDSQQGMQTDFLIDMEADEPTRAGSPKLGRRNPVGPVRGPPNEPGDTVALGFTPLFAVMTGRAGTTDALTSIFTFSTALRAPMSTGDRRPADGERFPAQRLRRRRDANRRRAADLPVYKTSLNPPINVCSRSPAATSAQQARQSRLPALRQRCSALVNDSGDRRDQPGPGRSGNGSGYLRAAPGRAARSAAGTDGRKR